MPISRLLARPSARVRHPISVEIPLNYSVFFVHASAHVYIFQVRNCIINSINNIIVVVVVTSQKWEKGLHTHRMHLLNNNSHTACSWSPVTLNCVHSVFINFVVVWMLVFLVRVAAAVTESFNFTLNSIRFIDFGTLTNGHVRVSQTVSQCGLLMDLYLKKSQSIEFLFIDFAISIMCNQSLACVICKIRYLTKRYINRSHSVKPFWVLGKYWINPCYTTNQFILLSKFDFYRKNKKWNTREANACTATNSDEKKKKEQFMTLNLANKFKIVIHDK